MQYGRVRGYGMIRYGRVRHGTVPYNSTLDSTVNRDPVRYNTVR